MAVHRRERSAATTSTSAGRLRPTTSTSTTATDDRSPTSRRSRRIDHDQLRPSLRRRRRCRTGRDCGACSAPPSPCRSTTPNPMAPRSTSRSPAVRPRATGSGSSWPTRAGRAHPAPTTPPAPWSRAISCPDSISSAGTHAAPAATTALTCTEPVRGPLGRRLRPRRRDRAGPARSGRPCRRRPVRGSSRRGAGPHRHRVDRGRHGRTPPSPGREDASPTSASRTAPTSACGTRSGTAPTSGRWCWTASSTRTRTSKRSSRAAQRASWRSTTTWRPTAAAAVPSTTWTRRCAGCSPRPSRSPSPPGPDATWVPPTSSPARSTRRTGTAAVRGATTTTRWPRPTTATARRPALARRPVPRSRQLPRLRRHHVHRQPRPASPEELRGDGRSSRRDRRPFRPRASPTSSLPAARGPSTPPRRSPTSPLPTHLRSW